MTLTLLADEVIEIDGETVARAGQQVMLLSPVGGALLGLLKARGPLPADEVRDALVEQFGDPAHPGGFDSTVNQLSRYGLIGLCNA